MTQTALAQEIGTTPQTAQRLENGRITLTVEWAEKIAEALGVSPAYLLRWDAPIDAPQDEKDLIELYRELPNSMKRTILSIAAAYFMEKGQYPSELREKAHEVFSSNIDKLKGGS
ncbi:MAG: hypothetical protein AXW12_09545 [Thalassospira sp. Nap_22]|nr:MAG: hypothetical protein AXW12_09545 [Thalassospira sp. Nap_22]